MERVIVTVKKYQETRVRDLDVPAGLEARQLAEVIASALHWDTDTAGGKARYRIEAYPLGRILRENETLASAGVGDGSWLTFIPDGMRVSPSDSQPVSQQPLQPFTSSGETAGPVKGWRSIELPGGTAVGESSPEPDHEPKKNSDGYTWKEIG